MIPAPQSHSKALGPGVTGPELAIASRVPHATAPRAGNPQLPASSGAAPFAVDPAHAPPSDGSGHRQHTQYPYVTGTSVLGVVYDGGVMLAADTLGAYGSTKRYKSLDRVVALGSGGGGSGENNANQPAVLVAAGGEVSDFQYILRLLDELVTDDLRADDGVPVVTPKQVHSYLTRVLYNRRNKFDPLWNTLVVAGIEPDGQPFLGAVGMIGVAYSDDHVATGFGGMLARPLFREKHDPKMSESEAEALIKEALRVCYYRDKQSMNKFTIGKVVRVGAAEGGAVAGAGEAGAAPVVRAKAEVSAPFALDVNWSHAAFARPTKWAVGAW
jgi:20S proteasome subunit beta 7